MAMIFRKTSNQQQSKYLQAIAVTNALKTNIPANFAIPVSAKFIYYKTFVIRGQIEFGLPGFWLTMKLDWCKEVLVNSGKNAQLLLVIAEICARPIPVSAIKVGISV
jgi:hypothetical protein